MAPDAGKLAAFKEYDFDVNEEWKAHLHNVELPGGAAAAAALQKVKAKWYKKVVDPDFDPSWLTAQQPSSTTGTSTPSAHLSQQQQQQQSNDRSSSSSSSGGRGAQATAQQPYARQIYLALLNTVILLLTVVYLQPIKPSVSHWAYLRLTVALLASQALKVYGAHGFPTGFSLAALKLWAGRVVPTSDAQYFLLALGAFVNPPPPWPLVLVPFVVLAAYNLAFFLNEHHSSHPLWQQHGARIYRWMLANQVQALRFNAQNEIMLGFLMIFTLLLPKRQPLMTLIVWNVLRLRYWSQDAAIYHRQVWAAFDQMTLRFRHQFPFLQKVVDFGVNYFHQGR